MICAPSRASRRALAPLAGKMPMPDAVRPLLRVASGCAVMVLAVLAWRYAMGDGLHAGLRLPAEVAMGVVVYGGVLWAGARDLVVDAFDALGLSRFLPQRAIREGE